MVYDEDFMIWRSCRSDDDDDLRKRRERYQPYLMIHTHLTTEHERDLALPAVRTAVVLALLSWTTKAVFGFRARET